MERKNITIFANMMINDAKRVQHLKDSFNSFKNISDNWLINIRGELRGEVIEFLKESLGEKMILFELLDEKKGWFENSLDMLSKAKNDYVLLWNEDHINMAPGDLYNDIIGEMSENNIDYLMYTWWLNGKYRKSFEVEGLKRGNFIDMVYLTKGLWKRQLWKGFDYYIISITGIFHKNFLIRLLKKERNKFPRYITTNIFRIMIVLDRLGVKFNHRKYYDFINRLIFGKLTKWPKDRPFDLEKSPYRFDILPIKMGLPKQELFACIDDDLNVKNYQLIKKGKYPIYKELKADEGEEERRSWGKKELLEKNHYYTVIKVSLKKGEGFSKRYYQDEQRTNNLLRKTIILMEGDLVVLTGDKEAKLSPGQTISVYTNIEHKVMTKEGAVFIEIISSLHNKKIKCIL